MKTLTRRPRRHTYRPAPPVVATIRHRRAKYTPAYRTLRRERFAFAGLIVAFGLLIVGACAAFVALFTAFGGVLFAVVCGGVILAAGAFQVVSLIHDGFAE